MNVIETKLPGVLIIEPKVHGDERGFFMETWHQSRYEKYGIPSIFVQDNLSFSRKGVLRGLHSQNPNSQGKLVHVLQGEVFDVAVDVRYGSKTFGEWVGVTLSSDNKRQLYVPEGFLHGFCVLSETVLFGYKCTNKYNPQAELGVLWNDPDIDIHWPISDPIVSDKDKENSRLCELDSSLLVFRS
ncbi:dTDP-4-dehydrorhamnose 3,5-epimerase [Dendrosporobacter sp. 1207_IL3150]|uniref:dTDP-4-dehydrorhamnose 3,5-epimerase n=1 Tax=Dendrosporobacter sp. 1207_IL3150 TaxID=3084054 RepID=UPI002FD9FA91